MLRHTEKAPTELLNEPPLLDRDPTEPRRRARDRLVVLMSFELETQASSVRNSTSCAHPSRARAAETPLWLRATARTQILRTPLGSSALFSPTFREGPEEKSGAGHRAGERAILGGAVRIRRKEARRGARVAGRRSR